MIENYKALSAKARELLQRESSPLSLKNGTWSVKERSKILDELASQLYDSQLDAFKSLAVSVLSERDPSLSLPPDERYASRFHDKTLKFSPALRKAMAEGLGMIGSKSSRFSNCSQSKVETIAILAVREIFEESDWVLWASLNSLLPALSEAAPDEFLKIVEENLYKSPCPFDELFAQEGDGIFVGSHISGLLWALESLAWDEKYLIHVCSILSELAQLDPGGKIANRPANSLAKILLPWFPQTMASIEKRKIAVETINKEYPDIAWKLIISLLPNQMRTSSGSHKPMWRQEIPEDHGSRVLQRDYWDQVSFYAELAVTVAKDDVSKLTELIGHANELPEPSFSKFLDALSSPEIINLPENKRLSIWNSLENFVMRHKRFSDASWSLEDGKLSAMERIADSLAPTSPTNLYQNLFTNRDFELYEENDNFEEQARKLDKKRQEAISTIFKSKGIDSVIEFSETVQSPAQVGQAFAYIADEKADKILLPKFLGSDNSKYSAFISAYIWVRRHLNDWTWLDKFDLSKWSVNQIAEFLSAVPFSEQAWSRAANWLSDSEGEYWKKANVNPVLMESNVEIAVSKLIRYGRPFTAISCLDWMLRKKEEISLATCIDALMAAVSSQESTNHMDSYHIENLIKYLQNNPNTNPESMLRVEWSYIPLLNKHHGLAPKFLETSLATNPDFFCEIIRSVYRSKNDKSPKEPSEDKQAIARNAWHLLFDWKTPPGMQADGSFDEKKFSEWIASVKKSCKESGHLEVALIQIGQVLIHTPEDANGLWINCAVANELNQRDAEKMREGYSTGVYNDRGVHWVDPTGKPERELAEKYRARSEAVENAGFHRFAVTLRKLAEGYGRDAERIIAEHRNDEE